MGAGYFLSGINKGIQYGLQHNLSKMNMNLLEKQQSLAEKKLNDPTRIAQDTANLRKTQLDNEKNQLVIDKYNGQGSGVTSQSIMSKYDQLVGDVSLSIGNPEDSKD